MKRIVTLLIAVLLCATCSFGAAADTYFPPEVYNTALQQSYLTDGDCRALNIFASNFAEIGLVNFYNEDMAAIYGYDLTPDEDILRYTLKNLELNPMEGMSSFIGNDGYRYMKIPESTLESRAETLFGRTVDASTYEGNHDGVIITRADHYDAELKVYAVVTHCDAAASEHEGYDDYYLLTCDIYRTEEDVSTRYNMSQKTVKGLADEKIGFAQIDFYYNGSDSDTTFSTSDFQLKSYRLLKDYSVLPHIPYQEANTPFTGDLAALEIPPTTTTKSVATSSSDAPLSTITSEKFEEPTTPQDTEEQRDSHTLMIAFLVIGVVLIAASGVALILFVIKKRRAK